MSNRPSKRGRRAPWQTWVCVAAALAATAWTVVYHFYWSTQPLGTALVFYCAVTAVLIYSLAAVIKGRSFTHLPAHEGRVLAIVPAYNEPPEALHKPCGRSSTRCARPTRSTSSMTAPECP